MGQCSTCGNDYPGSFDITRDGQTMTFDSFECAIEKMAPRCEHCGVRIVGHGIETQGHLFCCGHCARSAGQPHSHG